MALQIKVPSIFASLTAVGLSSVRLLLVDSTRTISVGDAVKRGKRNSRSGALRLQHFEYGSDNNPVT